MDQTITTSPFANWKEHRCFSSYFLENDSLFFSISSQVNRKTMMTPTTCFVSRHLPIIFVLILSVILVSNAYANVDSVTLNEGDSAFTLPSQAITNSQQGDAILSVELAGYDISSFAQLDQKGLHISLEIPIGAGEHPLQALLFWPNGDIDELVSTTVIVKPSSASDTKWKVNTVFSPQYRLDEKNVDQGEQSALTSTGSIDASADKTMGQWQVSSQMLAMYDSVNENDDDFNEWALAQFKLASRYKSETIEGEVSIGDGLAQKESLLFSSFQRRGLAASVSSSNQAYQLQIFDVKASPSTRYDGEILSDTSDDQAIGIQSSATIIDDHLGLSVGFVDGKTNLGEKDQQSPIFGGESWNIALDSYFLNDSLWLHAEYAESDFDSDGENFGEASQKDHALQMLVQLSSGKLTWFKALDFWSSHVQYQEVGKHYYSLGNMTLPGDLKLTQFYFQAGIQNVSFDLSLSEEKNNLDNHPGLATQTLTLISSHWTYHPTIQATSTIWKTLGAPSLYLNLSYQDHSQSQRDSLKVGFDLDNQTTDSSIGINFEHALWAWGVSYQHIVKKDNTSEIIQGLETLYTPPSDLETNIWSVKASWFPSNRVSMNTYIQWHTQSETDFNYDYINQNIGLDGLFTLVPETLSLSMNINLSKDTSDLGSSGFIEDDRSSHYSGAQLTWHAMKQDTHKALLDVYLRSNYGKQEDHAFDQSEEQWAIYVGTEFQWSAGGI